MNFFSRYERHFAPNVSLAPNSNKVAKSDGEDDVSENSLPSTVKAEDQSVSGTSKDYKEWDLPTESDDSSLALSDGGFLSTFLYARNFLWATSVSSLSLILIL